MIASHAHDEATSITNVLNTFLLPAKSFSVVREGRVDEMIEGTKGNKIKEINKDAPSHSLDEKWVDIIIICFLTIVGFYSRFYYLGHPNEVVFDEQHFGKFVNWYFKGEYYLDIHPPLGKLLLMLSGIVLGYNENLDYDGIGAPYSDPSFLSLRFLPAFFGGLLVPLMYITMRAIPVSISISAFGKIFLIFFSFF